MDIYFVSAFWGEREESARDCARRMRSCLIGLASCSRLLSDWRRMGWTHRSAQFSRIVKEETEIEQLFLRGRLRDSSRQLIRGAGHRIGLWLSNGPGLEATIHVSCGAGRLNEYIANSFSLSMLSDVPSEILRIDCDGMLCLLKTVVDAFDPAWATVMSGEHRRLLSDLMRSPYQPAIGWMTYLSCAEGMPRASDLACSMAFGKGIIVITTRNRFSVQNSEHMNAVTQVDRTLRQRGYLKRYRVR